MIFHNLFLWLDTIISHYGINLHHLNPVLGFGKFYNVVSQIGKPDCRGGDRRRKRERIEIERGRKSKKERHAPEGASRLKQVKMALQSVV